MSGIATHIALVLLQYLGQEEWREWVLDFGLCIVTLSGGMVILNLVESISIILNLKQDIDMVVF